jgi:hypothetical protein
VRYGWAAQQRVWVGPDRHRRRCGNTLTNSEPESHADGDSYAVCVRGGYTNSDADGNCYCDSDSNSYANGNRHSYSYSYSYANGYSYRSAYADAEICADAERSSHPSAETIETVVQRKFRGISGGAPLLVRTE